jgi:hypothetical protein
VPQQQQHNHHTLIHQACRTRSSGSGICCKLLPHYWLHWLHTNACTCSCTTNCTAAAGAHCTTHSCLLTASSWPAPHHQCRLQPTNLGSVNAPRLSRLYVSDCSLSCRAASCTGANNTTQHNNQHTQCHSTRHYAHSRHLPLSNTPMLLTGRPGLQKKHQRVSLQCEGRPHRAPLTLRQTKQAANRYRYAPALTSCREVATVAGRPSSCCRLQPDARVVAAARAACRMERTVYCRACWRAAFEGPPADPVAARGSAAAGRGRRRAITD